MGLYNSICFSCPGCFAQLEVQSKAGDTSFSTFYADAVPAVIAKDIENELVHCEKCDGRWMVVASAQINTLTMMLVPRGN